jgi:hypothetical protein
MDGVYFIESDKKQDNYFGFVTGHHYWSVEFFLLP